MSKRTGTEPANDQTQSARPKSVERKRGFYTSTFTAEEVRRLGTAAPEAQDERELLHTKILRLARLTPLRKINAPELETLIKLIRVVAALDALERTDVMRIKADASLDPALQALAELDPDDL
jgi:hypothetical protein